MARPNSKSVDLCNWCAPEKGVETDPGNGGGFATNQTCHNVFMCDGDKNTWDCTNNFDCSRSQNDIDCLNQGCPGTQNPLWCTNQLDCPAP